MSRNLAIIVMLFFALFFIMGTMFEIPTMKRFTDTKVVYQTVTEQVNNTIEVPVGEIYDKNVTVYGVAVFNDTSGGELIGIDMFLRAGTGSILLDISGNVFRTDIQETFSLIKSYAEAYTSKNLAYRDWIIKLDSEAESIGGISGSAAMAVGLIALIDDIELRESTVITGVLNPDGTIGPVSALDLKVNVSRDLGVDRLLIPKVECSSLDNSYKEGIDIVCVNSIKEALRHMTA